MQFINAEETETGPGMLVLDNNDRVYMLLSLGPDLSVSRLLIDLKTQTVKILIKSQSDV